jgi:VCBS repeat-containing protein
MMLLANDTDPEGQPLTAILQSGPGSGSLTLNSNGSFTYTPNADFNGTDSFTYFANDGTANSNLAATVTITVNQVPDPPTAVDQQSGSHGNHHCRCGERPTRGY